MPAVKTFASIADKVSSAITMIENNKTKQALTLLKKVKVSAEKRSGTGDKVAPKRKLNNYMKWAATERPNILKATPGLSIIEVSKLLGKKWKDVKETYVRSSPKSSPKPSPPPSPTKVAPKKKVATKVTKKAKAVEE